MSINVGALDRVVRISVGFMLVTWLLGVQGPARWWGLMGLVLLGTGWSSFCPPYRMLGARTS
ncbi:MAG: DUF2892 domain-containing protein [Betaproteobacteria bacterium]|nr:DUF2892 domain-containing protein [Betaproteobacteria bacterium]